tara:strand:+ start:858 stop:1028 length:171 start_codon:yes stop_codon:yes gene_type:complete
MNEKAQVSVEYLFTVLFALMLVIAVTVIAFQMDTMANRAQAQVIDNRNDIIQTLAG